MAHMDIDEFFLVKPARPSKVNPVAGALKLFVRKQFTKYPKAIALEFEPVQMISCPPQVYTNYNAYKYQPPLAKMCYHGNNSLPIFPRLGNIQGSEIGSKYEVKLIARTEAVEFLFTHFAPQVTSSNWNRMNVLRIRVSQGVVLHYRKEGGVAGVTFRNPNMNIDEKRISDLKIKCSTSIPMTLDQDLQMEIIKQPEAQVALKLKRRTVAIQSRVDYYYLGLDARTITSLINNYIGRLGSAF